MKETPTRSTGRKWNFDRLACNPNAMDVNAMTMDEHSSLMKKGPCFYCKEQDHISKECPKKKNKGYGRTPTRKTDDYKKYSKKDMATYVRGMTTDQKEALATELINNQKDSDDEDF